MSCQPSHMAFPKAGEPEEQYNGLTKREWFAAMAMQGFLASPPAGSMALVAAASVQMADTLINELSK